MSATALARVVVDELVRCGVREAVLCPGSRNAPLSFALHTADSSGRLRLHVRIDERTAGFLALGLALRSGRPVPVACTSGTAAANLHPALLEASYSGIPLLAITADRPTELVGTGANQTVVQAGLYGGAPRYAATVVGDRPGLWRSTVDRAVAAALGRTGPGVPGPAHLNVPFAEPLVPPADETWPRGRPHGAPWTAVPEAPPAAVTPLPLDPAAPTLLVGGHGGLPVEPSAGTPVVAEPTSPLWPQAMRTGPWLLRSPRWYRQLRPRQVVVVGRPTMQRAVQRMLADPNVEVYAVPGPGGAPGWPDTAGTVRAVGGLPPLRPPAGYAAAWSAADAAAGAALDRALDGDERGGSVGLRVGRALVAALPAGALLVLGSSNPVRDVSLAAAPRPGLTVLANRGASGIDGTVSTAVGAALAHGGPSYALLGDLTLLHDATGLVIGAGEPRPDVTIVVLNDDGGGIFSLLEQGAPEYDTAFERIFGTPHGTRLADLATAVGIPHTVAEHPESLPEKLAPQPGLRVIEVPAGRATLRAAHRAIHQAVEDAATAAHEQQ